MLVGTVSKSAIGICEQQFRPVIKPMEYGRSHRAPKSLNDIRLSPTVWGMCSNNKASEETGLHFDDQEPWVSSHNRQGLIVKPPLLVGCAVMVEGNRLCFSKP
jgi:hypothetical protein